MTNLIANPSTQTLTLRNVQLQYAALYAPKAVTNKAGTKMKYQVSTVVSAADATALNAMGIWTKPLQDGDHRVTFDCLADAIQPSIVAANSDVQEGIDAGRRLDYSTGSIKVQRTPSGNFTLLGVLVSEFPERAVVQQQLTASDF